MTRYAPQWLQAGSYAAGVDRRLLAALWPVASSTGCAVTPGSGMQVVVAPGQVAIPTANATGTTLCTSDGNENVTITAAPASGNNRIDLIVCLARGTDLDGGVNNDFVFQAVAGTVAVSPVAPAAPAGSVPIASVLIPGGSSSVTGGNITDLRPGNLAVTAVGKQISPQLPWNAPWGLVMPPATATGLGTGTSAGAEALDMMLGFQVAIPNRRIKASVNGLISNQSVIGDLFNVSIRDGGTGFPNAGGMPLISQQGVYCSQTGTNGRVGVAIAGTFVSTVGLHNIGNTAQRVNGTGVFTPIGTRELILEDIGPVAGTSPP